MSEVDHRLGEAVLHRDLVNISDMVAVCNERATEKHENQAREVHMDWLPQVTKEAYEKTLPLIDRSKLPCSIKGTHRWQFRVLDTRRVQFWSADGRVQTGVELKATVLPGFSAKKSSLVTSTA